MNINDLDPKDISSAPPADSNSTLNLRQLNPADIQTEEDFNDEKYGTPGQQALAGIEGLGKGFAGPVLTGAERLASAAGVPGLTPQDQAAREDVNPAIHFGTEATGFGIGAFTGTGEAAALSKIGEAASAAAKIGEAGSAISKIASTGIRGGAELAALQAGDEISKAINQDPGQSLGSAAINVGLSGLIGLGGGAALGGVSSAWDTAANKLGVSKFINDFMGETKFLQENHDLSAGAANEVNGRMAEADQILNGGLKGQAIEKALPSPTPENQAKIDAHLFDIANEGAKKIQEASENQYLKGAVPKLTQDLVDFQSVITDPQASIQQKWDALDSYKRASQAHANYNTVTGGAEEKAVSKWIKPFNTALKEAAENTKIWGEAGNIQKTVNESVSKLYDAQKDFLSKATTKELGDLVADPAKLQTLISQTEKGNGGLRANAVKNYLDATQKAADAINKAHLENGLEQPLGSTLNPTPVLDHVLGTPMSGGRTLAQYGFRKGGATLAQAAGNAAAGAVGGGLGAIVGHPIVGAYIGEKLLGHTFGVLAKPFAESAIDAAAAKASVDYVATAAKGIKTLQTATKSLLRGGEIIPQHLLPDEASREKLQKSLVAMDNPQNALKIGGNIGHYLPDHATAVAAMSAQAKNYLDQLKPKQIQAAPLDHPQPIDKIAEAKYERALDVAQQPLLVLQYAKNSTLLPQDVQTLNAIYPGLHAAMVKNINEQLIEAKAAGVKIPYQQRVSMTMLLGAPLDSTMIPANMQAVIGAAAPQQAPQNPGKPKKQSSASISQMNKVSDLYKTPADVRAADKRG